MLSRSQLEEIRARNYPQIVTQERGAQFGRDVAALLDHVATIEQKLALPRVRAALATTELDRAADCLRALSNATVPLAAATETFAKALGGRA